VRVYMPVETLFAALDVPAEPVVDANHENYRPGVREALGRAARSSQSDSRDVNVAEAETWNFGDRGRETRYVGTPSVGSSLVVQRPPGMGGFQFVVLSTLRAAQLMRGCRPRVDSMHKATITAQLEVSAGKVTQLLTQPSGPATIGVGPIEDVRAMVAKT
jgi:hypothetical protein